MNDATAREPSPTRPTEYSPGGIASTYVFLAGIFLPLLALCIELVSHASDAQLRIDPIPTPLHALWILTVPFACAWAAFRAPESERARRWLRACIGFALVTAAFYTLVYVVTTPIAVVAILMAGIGFLPLAPLLSFGALLICARATYRPLEGRGLPLVRGLVVGLALVGATWIPRLAVGYATDAALDEDPSRRATGLWVLRNVVPERALLDRCYFEDPAPPFESDFGVTGRGEGARARARSAYWLATGKSFNAAEAPEPWLALGRTRSLRNERDERAGVEIGGRVAQLSLSGSRLDGLLDPDALTGYLEWTLTFANASSTPAEARAELLLPPRAVVSRLTLWIDGKEREAAFAGNAQVRGAYQDVVQVKRLDPALVTQCGPDRVRLQCFPVPASGAMQVRLGITLPLDPLSADRAALELPRIAEHNFDVSDALERAIWLRSTHAFVAANGGSSATDDGGEPFRWSTATPELVVGDEGRSIVVERDAEVGSVVAPSGDGDDGSRSLARLEQAPAGTRPVVLVVDGSAALAPWRERLRAALAALPPELEIALVAALDEPRVLLALGAHGGAAVADAFDALDFEGGRDNSEALTLALDVAGARGRVLWLHGPQPWIARDPTRLQQRIERDGAAARLSCMPLAPGRQRVLEALPLWHTIQRVPRAGELGADLTRAVREAAGLERGWRVRHELCAADAVPADARASTSVHVAKLAWRDRIETLARGTTAERAAAATLARERMLVTTGSGAVVLQTAQQYAAHDLRPIDPDDAPSVPEPETIALLAIGAAALVWLRLRTRAA